MLEASMAGRAVYKMRSNGYARADVEMQRAITRKKPNTFRARWENCHGLVPSDCSGINSVVYAISMATKDECEARQKEDMLLAYVPVFQMLLCRYKEPSSYF